MSRLSLWLAVLGLALAPGAVRAKAFWAVTTPDAARAAAWYQRHLGLTHLQTLAPGGGTTAVLVVDGPLATVEIAERPAALPVDGPPWTYRGIFKAGVYVDDLDVWVARWKADGVEFVVQPRVMRPGEAFTVIRDADRNSIHIIGPSKLVGQP